MISITEQELKKVAEEKGYRPEILEKVYRLLGLLEIFMAVPFLKERLVLKGGTAINLFCTQQLPRLSLDLDFNYVGSLDRETMRREKPEVERIMLDLCRLQGYELHRNSEAHAGGKMVLIYSSLLGTKGRLELDINYLYRSPLWETQWQYSADWPRRVGVVVLDIHELAGGKLHALLDRHAARDLFDTHQLMTKWPLDLAKLRVGFTVYAGMRKLSWEAMSTDKIFFDVKEIRNKLIPVLKRSMIPGTRSKDIQAWGEQLVSECKIAFQGLLPFNEQEKLFLTHLEEQGEIKPEFLSSDPILCERIKTHPLLKWRIQQSKQR
ncbi:MAG: nucleotidyl transferase AbiEii/AbiGii toxin family protein [Proteobacteria bacterium]|nr:nucleotidyl transferase AbiEii/AbiGii toxin family protein [Pseudomonadota bacterium]